MENSLPENLSRAISMTLAFVLTLIASTAQAAEPKAAPFQLALWNPLQIIQSERSIHGFRYSLFWGVNQDLSGLDISTIASQANGSVRGCQLGVMLNTVGGDFTGFQTSLLNTVGGNFSGFQFGLFSDSTGGHVRGMQWSLTGGSSAGEITGVQSSGFINSMKRGRGVQAAGLVNLADKVTGLQAAGLLNIAEDLKGLQLGLLNFNKNGFLPFFPIFNVGL
jgi:hypothetical protein